MRASGEVGDTDVLARLLRRLAGRVDGFPAEPDPTFAAFRALEGMAPPAGGHRGNVRPGPAPPVAVALAEGQVRLISRAGGRLRMSWVGSPTARLDTSEHLVASPSGDTLAAVTGSWLTVWWGSPASPSLHRWPLMQVAGGERLLALERFGQHAVDVVLGNARETILRRYHYGHQAPAMVRPLGGPASSAALIRGVVHLVAADHQPLGDLAAYEGPITALDATICDGRPQLCALQGDDILLWGSPDDGLYAEPLDSAATAIRWVRVGHPAANVPTVLLQHHDVVRLHQLKAY